LVKVSFLRRDRSAHRKACECGADDEMIGGMHGGAHGGAEEDNIFIFRYRNTGGKKYAIEVWKVA